jgi:predicted amidohydrolase YtcJ
MLPGISKLIARYVFTLCGVIIFSSQAVFAQSLPVIPDTILVNGKIITADSDEPEDVSIVEAIAVRDGTIVAVGSNATIRGLAVQGTEVVDLKGHTVVPGLIDTHTHLYESSLGFPWAANIDPQLHSIALTATSEDHAVELAEAAIRARARDIGPGNG